MLKLVPLGSCRDLPRGFWGCELDYDVDSGPPHWRWRYWIHVVLGISPAKWLASEADHGIPHILCFARLHQIHLASLKSSKHKKTKLRNHSPGEGPLRRHKHKRSKAIEPMGAIFIFVSKHKFKEDDQVFYQAVQAGLNFWESPTCVFLHVTTFSMACFFG